MLKTQRRHLGFRDCGIKLKQTAFMKLSSRLVCPWPRCGELDDKKDDNYNTSVTQRRGGDFNLLVAVLQMKPSCSVHRDRCHKPSAPLVVTQASADSSLGSGGLLGQLL